MRFCQAFLWDLGSKAQKSSFCVGFQVLKAGFGIETDFICSVLCVPLLQAI